MNLVQRRGRRHSTYPPPPAGVVDFRPRSRPTKQTFVENGYILGPSAEGPEPLPGGGRNCLPPACPWHPPKGVHFLKRSLVAGVIPERHSILTAVQFGLCQSQSQRIVGSRQTILDHLTSPGGGGALVWHPLFRVYFFGIGSWLLFRRFTGGCSRTV